MKAIKSLLFIFIITLSLVTCIGSAHNEKVIDGYSLAAQDVKEDMTLVFTDSQDYQFNIVNPTVFEMGNDEDYIITKQHPRLFPNAPDKSITNYFIIPLKDKVRNAIGPLTEEEFKVKRTELGVSEKLTFTIVFDDLK